MLQIHLRINYHNADIHCLYNEKYGSGLVIKSIGGGLSVIMCLSDVSFDDTGGFLTH